MKLPFLLLFISIFFLSLPLNAQVLINEFSAANLDDIADNYGEYEDWIELYNAGTTPTNLTGYYLSDDPLQPTKWQFPAGINIAAGGHILVWASGRDEIGGGGLHTNFKITQTRAQEAIVLADPTGTVIDLNEIEKPNKRNNSSGRITDGAAEWGVFTNATPGTTNTGAKIRYADTPNIIPASGNYNAPTQITIETTEPNATIRYTTNGNFPTGTSTIYTGPFMVNATQVVRAVVYSTNTDILSSFAETNTYFINETHSIKVVSICGAEVANLLGGAQVEIGGGFELFDETLQKIDEGYGEFNEHGNDSWAYDQRGFDFVMRDDYGYDYAVKDQIFKNSDRDKFQRLIFKPAANDNYPFQDGGAHIRDAYVHVLSQKAQLELDERSYEPCIIYLNGQYWGVYEIREKVDDHDFTDYYYGKNDTEIDFIQTWGATWNAYGDMNDWNNLHNYIISNDMAQAANYTYVTDRMNMQSLIDYIIINTHSVCSDWLNYNTAWWHSKDNSVKWRYTLWDMDATFGHYINYTGIPDVSPTADPCDNEDPDISDPEGHIAMLTALYENPDFYQQYINRYADLNNSYFSCDFMLGLLDSMINRIEPEMPRQIARWGGGMNEWQQNVQELRDFITTRCTVINTGIGDCYAVTGPFDVNIDVQPALSGNIAINNFIFPDNYPWAGQYFGEININLLATPSTGYLFDYWELDNGSITPNIDDPNVLIDLSAGGNIIAHFKPIAPEYDLMINIAPANAGSVLWNATAPLSYPWTTTEIEGTNINLNAIAQTGFVFDHWELNQHTLTPNNNTADASFTVASTDTIVAHFIPIVVSLTIDAEPSIGGSIGINGTTFTDTDYPANLSFNYDSLLNIIATPQTGFTFVGWQINNHTINNSNPNTTFNITQNDTLRALFEPIPVQLTLLVEPEGMGTISLNGNLLTDNPSTSSFVYGNTVNLSAMALAGYDFVGWTSNNHALTPNNQSNEVAVNLTANDTIIAHFTEHLVTITINISNAQGGNIIINGQTVDNFPYQLIIAQGSNVIIAATTNEGFTFGSWQTTLSGIDLSQSTLDFDAQENITINVLFMPINCNPAKPTAFSPNNDEKNDVFRLLSACPYQNYRIRIFDRWGQMVFETNDRDKGWNGTHKGDECNTGVYIWVAEYETLDGDVWVAKVEKGNITLVR